MGIHAPAIDEQTIRCKFIEKVREILLGYCDANIILAGDFNIKLSALDSDNPRYIESRATLKLKDLLDEFALEDTWRVQHSK